MRKEQYIAPEAEIVLIAPDLNFVETTGGGTGENVGIGGNEETDW